MENFSYLYNELYLLYGWVVMQTASAHVHQCFLEQKLTTEGWSILRTQGPVRVMLGKDHWNINYILLKFAYVKKKNFKPILKVVLNELEITVCSIALSLLENISNARAIARHKDYISL